MTCIQTLQRITLTVALAVIMSIMPAKAQEEMRVYVKHSSGLFLADGGSTAVLAESNKSKQLHFIPDGAGYYNIAIENNGKETYLSLSGQWNTVFGDDASSDNAKFSIVGSLEEFVLIRCKANGRFLGTDDNKAGAHVYSDKDGGDSRHLWFLNESKTAEPAVQTAQYMLNPQATRQLHEGWGVSLCWWAGQCGKWSDEKIDQIVDWLVSPTGLNFNIFRYNIGGGDDPNNANCDPHHMGRGKGLRAEMEGFKDSSDDEYHWERDAAQRKIMLKIKEKRPDAVFEAFSNSAPYYMTYSGCCSGNFDAGKDNLRPEYYTEFANYLVDVCKHYKEVYGIEFVTLDPFNEPNTGFWGANGVQEGCHFDYASQIAFLKVLHPILKASDLKTVISAADETNVGTSIGGFDAYRNAGILDLVGQWNTHTYSANNKERAKLSSLTHSAGIKLWMSETGSGGSGIGGNLNMAQRLINDVKYLAPAAWIDWQYMEELNDQWCMLQGSFAEQTYKKVKNYYVRQNFSRFIKVGYNILATPNEQTLAAVNATRDTLVLVALNTGANEVNHSCRLIFCDAKDGVKCYRTSKNENLRATKDYELNNGLLTFTMPGQSIVTFVIPMTQKEQAAADITDGGIYAIQPQYNTALTLTTKNGGVTIEKPVYNSEWQAEVEDETAICTPISESQSWQLKADGTAYRLMAMSGEYLTTGSSYRLATAKKQSTGQLFEIKPVDDINYKIVLKGDANGRALDLENEGTTEGTVVGLWQYGTSPAAGHRNWQLVRLPLSAFASSISSPALAATFSINDNILTVKADSEHECTLTLYSISGSKILETKFNNSISIPLGKGTYVVKADDGSKSIANIVRL